MSAAFWFMVAVCGTATLAFITLVVWLGERRKEREAHYRSEAVKKVAESGNSAVLEYLRETERVEAARGRIKARLAGLIAAAVGAALLIFLHELGPETKVYLVGLVPLFVGVVLLVFSELMMKPKE